jgi:hypothetical protein
MRALRCRPADAVGRVDAELVRLDVPRLLAVQVRAEPGEGAEQARPDRLRLDARRDRLEPALEAAVQRVVFERLPVRAMRREVAVRKLEALARGAALARERYA